MAKKQSLYDFKLYNTLGPVTALSRSRGVEIYYRGKLKFPSRETKEIPPYPPGIKTTRGKYLYIKALIRKLEEKRLIALKKAKLRREKRKAELRQEESEFIDLVKEFFVKKRKEDKAKYKERETEKVITPQIQKEEIQHSLYKNGKAILPVQFDKADSFMISFGERLIHPMDKFPVDQKASQKKSFVSKIIKKYLAKYAFDVFESDPYTVITRDKMYAKHKRWTLRYHNDIVLASSQKKDISQDIINQMFSDFSYLADFMWEWLPGTQERFLIKLLTKEYDKDGTIIDYSLATWAQEQYDRPVKFYDMPDEKTVRFWEEKGFAVMPSKDSADYRFAVYTKKIIHDEVAEFRMSGFSAEMVYFHEKERFLQWFRKQLLELFIDKQVEYLERRYTNSISLTGFFIELNLELKI